MTDKDMSLVEIIRLIEKGLSDVEIAKSIPFRSDYVKTVRENLNKV